MQASITRLTILGLLLCLLLGLGGCVTQTPSAQTSGAKPSGSATNEANVKQPAQVLNYQKSDSEYYALVAKIRSKQAQSRDYDMLIRLYPFTSLYKPKSDLEQSAKLRSQSYMQNQQWQLCLRTNEQLLNVNYTSLTGHYGVAICAAEMGNIELGRFHNAVLDNFIEAIWRTGSGQTPESPFYITSVNDLYAFVQLHQLVAVGQSLSYVDNFPIQAITVQNPETLRTFTWYFNVTPQFRRGVIDSIEGEG